MDVYGCPWMSMDIHGYPWMSMDVHGYPWISIDTYGYSWISMDVHGYPYMDIMQGHPWISMEIHGNGYQWIYMDYQWISIILFVTRWRAAWVERMSTRKISMIRYTLGCFGCLESTRENHTSRMGRVSNYLVTGNVWSPTGISFQILFTSNSAPILLFVMPLMPKIFGFVSDSLGLLLFTNNVLLYISLPKISNSWVAMVLQSV